MIKPRRPFSKMPPMSSEPPYVHPKLCRRYKIRRGGQNTAADIIIDETKRMTHLVEDLLYLSRLDTIEENYHEKWLNTILPLIPKFCTIFFKRG